jgi:hypothetical protein
MKKNVIPWRKINERGKKEETNERMIIQQRNYVGKQIQ